MKKCCLCNEVKSIDSFHRNKGNKDGYSYVCKSCQHEYHKKSYVPVSDYSTITESIIGEVWKDVENYETIYMVSNLGRVKSLSRRVIRSNSYPLYISEKILSSYLTHGYPYVVLCDNGINYKISVHLLVAKAFIPNVENYPCVNHINGIKADNRVENLEWCTYSYNNSHAYKIGLKSNANGKSSRAKLVLDTNTGIFYDCIKEAAFAMNVLTWRLSLMLNGKWENKTNLIFC